MNRLLYNFLLLLFVPAATMADGFDELLKAKPHLANELREMRALALQYKQNQIDPSETKKEISRITGVSFEFEFDSPGEFRLSWRI